MTESVNASSPSSSPMTQEFSEPEGVSMDLETFLRMCGVGSELKRSWKKRKRRSKEEDEADEGQDSGQYGGGVFRRDPLEVLGRDLMLKILGNLDARSVALSLVVCRAWHGVASSDTLWASKNRIMRDDLCDHVWEFHFTKAAPEYWQNLDPYWKGTGPVMRRYFHPDGSLTADPGDKIWSGHECCYSVITSYDGEGSIREHYVRVNRWPRMYVHRKQDWSWEMSNSIYCYSSVPDAYKEGGTGPLLIVM
ncbi:hypothetical protein K2173_003646 [Erythroxylum novogranatense]|uniref:F-box domain-containing protein n=1 Tax=Erythroxylum novogranatense TaxID=1862640 RepID=A0AAV8TC00_9ROSI|nr:hypothetical protein K2173_003646 [Erythroxylum novogranatense]